jgi:hypothetical protein
MPMAMLVRVLLPRPVYVHMDVFGAVVSVPVNVDLIITDRLQ